MTGTQASGWYIENAVKAMDDGKIKFAGKYSEPDYEMLVDEDCDLAIESTMILHTPKVQEMIESLDIPVMIDRSSYESHPLGRTEWIKLYAAMLNKEDAADAFFEKQVENVDALKDFKNTEKTVAFFYVSSDGTVVVRRSDDYIPKMIELSGGRYVFDDLTGDELPQRSRGDHNLIKCFFIKPLYIQILSNGIKASVHGSQCNHSGNQKVQIGLSM